MRKIWEFIEPLIAIAILFIIVCAVGYFFMWIVIEIKERPVKTKEESIRIWGGHKKFQRDTLTAIEEAWKKTEYYTAFKKYQISFQQYLSRTVELQKPNFRRFNKKDLLFLIAFQTFTYSYYINLDLKEYFSNCNVNQVIFEMMGVLLENYNVILVTSHFMPMILKEKDDIVSATKEKITVAQKAKTRL